MIFSLIIGLIFKVFVILQIFFDGWFESRNTEKNVDFRKIIMVGVFVTWGLCLKG